MGADFSISGSTQVCVINSQSRQFQRVQSVANDKTLHQKYKEWM
jgi:hypothetical protein